MQDPIGIGQKPRDRHGKMAAFLFEIRHSLGQVHKGQVKKAGKKEGLPILIMVLIGRR